jgi:adenylate cyclase class 2
MGIEIEKKYRLTPEQRTEVVESLEEFGAVFVGEDLEENTLFSNDDLFARNAVVRIRRIDDRAILTFKQRIASNSDAKQQIEHESEVADAGELRSILESIGLSAALVYEKRRKTYKVRSVELVLDELPFGQFMEIEGPITAIAEVEMLLGLEDLEVEHETYPRLTAKHGKRKGAVIESRFSDQR